MPAQLKPAMNTLTLELEDETNSLLQTEARKVNLSPVEFAKGADSAPVVTFYFSHSYPLQRGRSPRPADPAVTFYLLLVTRHWFVLRADFAVGARDRKGASVNIVAAATNRSAGWSCHSERERYIWVMSKAEQLQLEVRSLPETVAAQVLEFLATVKSRPPGSCDTGREVIAKIRGSWRGKLSSSDEFAALKADEIRLDE
jgi:hypothetical protein